MISCLFFGVKLRKSGIGWVTGYCFSIAEFNTALPTGDLFCHDKDPIFY